MSSRLDPDRLAELEVEQAFLLRSLDDLDDEYAAGDISEHDYAELTDDYTRRIAEVTRSIETRQAAFGQVDNSLTTRQRILTIAGVVIVAVLAGLLLARASGFRSPTDSLSGDIRQTSTGLLAEADTLTREGRWQEAADTYGEVLDVSPANVEALTYQGWIQFQLGESDKGLASIDEAIAIDPEYVDPRVFKTIILDREQRFDEAAEQLAVLDTLDVPPEMLGLVNGSGLRASVTGGQIMERFASPGESVDLDQIDASIDNIVAAGVALYEFDVELSLRVFLAVLDTDPDNYTALVGAGNIQTNPQIVEVSRETGERGLALLDRALELEPGDSQVRLSRAAARGSMGDRDGAAEDLALVERQTLPDEFHQLFDDLVSEYG